MTARSLHPALEIDWGNLVPGSYRKACGICSKSLQDKTLGVTILSDRHGVAHCFRCGYVETRHEQRAMTLAEKTAYQRRMDALRRDHDAAQRKCQADAAAAAVIRWAAAENVVDHPYLRAKGVQAHGVRVEAGRTMLVPMRDTEGRMHSLQSIAPNGSKRFMREGRVKGCYCAIGKPSDRLVVCEGYATGATIYEDTGHAVAVAFNSGNLLAVAKALRSKYPHITLVVAADDDWRTDGNPGLTAATDAARAVDGLLAVPNFTGYARGAKDTDFNDLHCLTRAAEERR